MNTNEATIEAKNFSSEKVLLLVSQMLGANSGNGSNPDPDNPMPHGPWDPYIRRVLQKIEPQPNPWHQRWQSNPLAFLNPQPLPPGEVFVRALTQEVIDHSLLVKEVADGIHQSGEERSIIIVSGNVRKYLDDFDELCPRWLDFLHLVPHKGPGPGPGEPYPIRERASAIECLMAAVVFQENARMSGSKGLHEVFHQAAVRLTEMSVSRM